MKIKGEDVKGFPEEFLVLQRGGHEVVFHARGLDSMEEFETLCPMPSVPRKTIRGGKTVDDVDNPDYVQALELRAQKRMAYMVLKSLEPTEIEWDTVKMDNPGTWVNWSKDLKAAGFTEVECNRILQLVIDANCLNEGKLMAAREAFLRGLKQDQAQ